mmetsp:Transcript_14356/g.41237  ORF Transcript_14356/g.41237 Transcript_14356/m.41237 type:complete len:339 (+) Transcript_14356:1386-2402(+)
MSKRSLRTKRRERQRLALDESMSMSDISELLDSRKASVVRRVEENTCNFICNVLFIALGMSFTDASRCAINALLVSVLKAGTSAVSPASCCAFATGDSESPLLDESPFNDVSCRMDVLSPMRSLAEANVVANAAGATAFAASMARCTSSTQASRSSGSWLQNTNTRRMVCTCQRWKRPKNKPSIACTCKMSIAFIRIRGFSQSYGVKQRIVPSVDKRISSSLIRPSKWMAPTMFSRAIDVRPSRACAKAKAHALPVPTKKRGGITGARLLRRVVFRTFRARPAGVKRVGGSRCSSGRGDSSWSMSSSAASRITAARSFVSEASCSRTTWRNCSSVFTV